MRHAIVPRPILLFVILATWFVIGCAPLQPAARPADDRVPSLAALDARLGVLRDTSGVPAMAVAVLAGPPGEARVVWSHGYGVLNARTGVPATVDSPFMLASASKPATGIVVMQAVEAGHLSLDAQVVPPFKWGGSPDVTLRRLATHTSGIVDTDAVDAA
jgi:CubicO group peptidase (beta-lactamase class C family)